MIYDCFTFYNELDLLEIRLNELSDVVDKFVIAESTHTFSGNLKQLYYQDNSKRFEKYADKIISIVVDEKPSDDPWDNESNQRIALNRAIDELCDNDIVMVSDVDEIPEPKAVSYISANEHVYELQMRWFHYYLNYEMPTVWAPGLKASSVKVYRDQYGNNPGTLRTQNRGSHIYFKNAGWHFAYLYDIKDKISAYSHQENNTPEMLGNINRCVEEKVVFWDESRKLTRVDIDSTFPAHIIGNRDKYARFIMEAK